MRFTLEVFLYDKRLMHNSHFIFILNEKIMYILFYLICA